MNESKDGSNRLHFDFEEIGVGRYTKITKSVVSEFGLEPNGERTDGLDERFQDFKKGSYIVGLEWDIWFGYIVVSKTQASDSLARQIASFVDTSERELKDKPWWKFW